MPEGLFLRDSNNEKRTKKFEQRGNGGGETPTSHRKGGSCRFYTRAQWVRYTIALLFLVTALYLSDHMMNPRVVNMRTMKGKESGALKCPAKVSVIKNYVDSFSEYVESAQNQTENIESFLENYRQTKFDDWLRTYSEILEGMKHWKSSRFPPNIKSGEMIYESACGIGLNLIMTLEILSEHGIKDITVHGNEYLQGSVDLAQTVLDRLAPSFGGHKGSICQGDSTSLNHIPNNTFDLVYTGYMSPLYDPLELNLDYEQSKRRIQKLCQHAEDDWKSRKLLEIAAARQSDWHGRWVGEMVRIAKPGKAIIIEQLRESGCKARPNVIGQTHDWWRQAIQNYNWDVDPSSMDFEKDKLFAGRYHVLMRKNVE